MKIKIKISEGRVFERIQKTLVVLSLEKHLSRPLVLIEKSYKILIQTLGDMSCSPKPMSSLSRVHDCQIEYRRDLLISAFPSTGMINKTAYIDFARCLHLSRACLRSGMRFSEEMGDTNVNSLTAR